MSFLRRVKTGRVVTVVAATLALVGAVVFSIARIPSGVAQEETLPQAKATYAGAKQCAACHFPQFRTWRDTAHQEAFKILPAKYHNDADCLKCHAPGAAEAAAGGGAINPELAGVTCEGCHGPGSEHARLAQQAITVDISPETERAIRESAQTVVAAHTCVQCHVTRAHRAHPEYDKE